jgi:nicotinate-nucleotide adenylyltransferase
VGVFGGTFDPPHLGHMAAAQAACRALDLEHVLFVVAGEPWQKAGAVGADAEDRFEMVRRSLASVPRMSASRVEIESGGPSYTAETLEILRSEAGGAWLPEELHGREIDLFLVLGADAAGGIERWHRAADIAGLARIVVVTRPGSEAPAGRALGDFVGVEMDVAASSTSVRDALAAGNLPEAELPHGAAEVILERGLYGLSPSPGRPRAAQKRGRNPRGR